METLTRSKTLLVLLVTQLLSLASLLVWGVLFLIFSNYSKSGYDIMSAGISFAIFTVYPIVPVSMSAFAWIAFRLRRLRAAVISSSIPAALALLLMIYYYIIGVTQH